MAIFKKEQGYCDISAAAALTGGKIMIISKNYRMGIFSEKIQAGRYLVFARQAEKEGFPQIARLFRATAQGEAGQAQARLQPLRPMGITRESPWAGAAGGKDESGGNPALMNVAAAQEGRKKPPRGRKSADRGEKAHTPAYLEALAKLAGMSKGDYYVCTRCGFIRERQCHEKCSHCHSESISLVKVG
jgi:rubrerythrin